MRNRFHSICPYFAMFPETFAEKHLAASGHEGVVFDGFSGRGTTVFQSLMQGRRAAGCDVHPVAACVSGAKCDPPTEAEVAERIDQLEEQYQRPDVSESVSDLEEFFLRCFERNTLGEVAYLRSSLKWKYDRTDRFIAALSLGALHGESHRSPNCFSNRMPRTISTKPAYSIRWWKKHGYEPPRRDVFEILRRVSQFRFRTPPPELRGEVAMCDARDAAVNFRDLKEQVTDIITSPPYLDTTDYREDQWLRCWFLGEKPAVGYGGSDHRHSSAERYWTFLREAWCGLAPLLSERVRIVVRIGGRRLTREQFETELVKSIVRGTGRSVSLIDPVVTSEVRRSQANTFRGSKPTSILEHDFCFAVG